MNELMHVRHKGVGDHGGRAVYGATLSSAVNPALLELLAIRSEFPNYWGTLDVQAVCAFEDLLREIGARGKAILEIGSGYGFTCVLLALLGAAEVHGVELIPSVVQAANMIVGRLGRGIPLCFEQTDVSRGIPYGDTRFDVVLMIEVLSHAVVPDLGSFVREVVRIVRPGGLVVISDGNNARSWKRRRENYRLWERFDQGPPTEGDDTVYSHRIATPYVALRRAIAQAAAPSLLPGEVDTIAARTFGFDASEVEAAARRFVDTGEWPRSPFRRGVCPVEPTNRMYIEQLLDPLEIRRHLRAAGCEDITCGPRCALPFKRLWTVAPRLTLLIANGFKIIAKKATAAAESGAASSDSPDKHMPAGSTFEGVRTTTNGTHGTA